MTEERKLADIIAHLITMRDGEIKISPSWVATEAMQGWTRTTSPMLVHAGCICGCGKWQGSSYARNITRIAMKNRNCSMGCCNRAIHRAIRNVRMIQSTPAEHLSDNDISYGVARLRAGHTPSSNMPMRWKLTDASAPRLSA